MDLTRGYLRCIVSVVVVLSAAELCAAAGQAGCLAACPKNPTSDCDFYFKGFPSALPPPFSLSAKAKVEQVLGTVLLNSPTVKLSNIASTDPGCTTTAIPPGTTPAGTTGTQFYGTGTHLKARTFNTPNVTAFVPNCVKLPIKSAQLQNGTQTINLNTPGGNPNFPVGRRCIVFKIVA